MLVDERHLWLAPEDPLGASLQSKPGNVHPGRRARRTAVRRGGRTPAEGPRRAASARAGFGLGLRTEPLEEPGEGDRLPHVVEPADPRDAALDAHSEARVRHGAVAP